jgi:soluble lytic murein transglycosylase-like protein
MVAIAHAAVSSEVAQCVSLAAERYAVPELLLYAIMRQEGGKPGTVSRNRNKTVDMGRMQINSSWLPQLAAYGITANHLVWAECTNIGVSAWILRTNYVKTRGDWSEAILRYNVGVPKTRASRDIGVRYARSVLTLWWGYWKKYTVAAE